jgi:SAM-dependent methyltransferase
METITKEQLEREKKFILDVCCGPKLFWFQKEQPNTIFMDNRERERGYNDYRPNREIQPDLIADFRELPFEDNSFKLVIMDPPHIFAKGETFRMVKDYGYLNKETWKEDIKKGFDECWRVLEDKGVLVFKWNEASVKRKEVLEVLEKTPLFGHPNLSKIPTHWFCFMKIPKVNLHLNNRR